MITIKHKFSRIFMLFILVVILTTVTSSCVNQEREGMPKKTANMPIVLLTDFGIENYSVSQLKGIIYTKNPEAKLIDASHSVPAFDINIGAFILDIAAKEFPENVVFVAIVDPYSQLEIKYFVLTTDKNQYFVLPDNGLVTYVAANMGIKNIYQVTNQDLFDQPINELSAERIQGITGALISSGLRPQDVGTPLTSTHSLYIQEAKIVDNKILGTVVYIDHFGNCITNISDEIARGTGLKTGDTIQVKTPHRKISATFGTTYSDVPQQKEIVFVNSNLGMIQLSINLGNFAETYYIEAGTKIEIVQ